MMKRRLLAAIATAAFLSFAPVAAHALSCAPPQHTKHSVDNAAAIFEGVVVGDRREDVNIKPGDTVALDKNVSYSFLVSRAWKGVTDGETVVVRRNVYWGDGFQMGGTYLVFAERRDTDGVLVAGLCGLTGGLEYADETRKFLAETLGAATETPAPVVTHAPRCAPMRMSQELVDSTAAIFEGVVTGAHRIDTDTPPGTNNTMDKKATFTFLVNKSWKGVTEGNAVVVRRNIYWGDAFQMGKAYVVFAENVDEDGVLVSGLCSPTMEAEQADMLRLMLQAVQNGTGEAQSLPLRE